MSTTFYLLGPSSTYLPKPVTFVLKPIILLSNLSAVVFIKFFKFVYYSFNFSLNLLSNSSIFTCILSTSLIRSVFNT